VRSILKDRRNWPAALLLVTILAIWTIAVAQQGNQSLPAGSSNVGGSPTQWFSAIAQYGAKHDAHQIVFNQNGINGTITTGSCSISDVGKNIFGVNTANGNTFTVTSGLTIASCPTASTFTVAGGTGSGITSGDIGWIGSDDTTAINNCIAAASAAAGVCYLPGVGGTGTAYFVIGPQIPATATLVGPYEVTGDTMDLTRIVFPPFAIGTSLLKFTPATNINVTVQNLAVDNGVQSNVTGTALGLAVFNNFYTYRVRVSNWNASTGQFPCFYSSVDGVQSSEIESTGCWDGIEVAATNMTIFRPIINANNSGVHNFDTNTMIFGGFVTGSTQAILADVQAGHGAIWLYGVSKATASGHTVVNTISGSNVYVYGGVVGGNKDCASTTNVTGITVVSGAVVTMGGVEACSNGTGFTVNNSGTFNDNGGNIFPAIGAGKYTGTGVLNNYSVEPSIGGRCLIASGAGPLACGFSASGKVAVPITTATYTINTNAVATGSSILVTPTTDNTGIPGAPACGAEVFGDGAITASVAQTSFTFAQTSAAVIKCYNWSIR
jgi:hypothetical protein